MSKTPSPVCALAILVAACGSARPTEPVVPLVEPTREVVPVEAETPLACPAIEVLPNPVVAPRPESVEGVRAAFEAVARGGASSAFDDAGSTMLALVARLHACPSRWDGEHITFAERELGTLPLTSGYRFDQATRTGRDVLETGAADDIIARRAQIDALRTWLDAHPGTQVSQQGTSYVTVDELRTDASLALRIRPRAERPIADVPGAELMVSISPPPQGVAWLDRAEPPARDDDGDDVVRASRVLAWLDGATYALRSGALVPERVRLARGEQWQTEALPRRGAAFTVTALEAWSGPDAAILDALHPEHLDARTVRGADVLCHEREGRWACADATTARRIGSVQRVEERGGALWVGGRHCDGGSESEECSDALHLLALDRAALVHRGSIAMGYMSGERERDVDDERTEVAGSTESVRYAWTAGEDCAVLGEPVAEAVEYHAVHPARGRERVDRRQRALSPRYEGRPERLAPFAVTLDRSGVRLAGAPAEGDDARAEAEGAPTLEDRRGAWRLDGAGWARAEQCDAR